MPQMAIPQNKNDHALPVGVVLFTYAPKREVDIPPGSFEAGKQNWEGPELFQGSSI